MKKIYTTKSEFLINHPGAEPVKGIEDVNIGQVKYMVCPNTAKVWRIDAAYKELQHDKRHGDYDLVIAELTATNQNKAGYVMIGLDGIPTARCKIVAETFLPHAAKYQRILHLNGDKTDDRVQNLRWCTHRDLCRLYWAREKGKDYEVRTAQPLKINLRSSSQPEQDPAIKKLLEEIEKIDPKDVIWSS